MSKWDFIKTLLKEVENDPKNKDLLRYAFGEARDNTKKMDTLRRYTDPRHAEYNKNKQYPNTKEKLNEIISMLDLDHQADEVQLDFMNNFDAETQNSGRLGKIGLNELRKILRNKNYITDDAISDSEKYFLRGHNHNELYDEILQRIGDSKDKKRNAQIGSEYLQELFTKE